ncbi:hypothetical protein MUY27_02415 [Mucilaginibacter sp. RS28]|uniref:Uncharacterized protein n=1 Tax=Mucilaginibacter straminoryzae TaxID=2932774 RepID=A0A9X2B7P1_9SPHI|nr:hypothetical protein [Mucilaginibacter straminoryzae]MCJ8208546.1 hypothetical protein [Mucilaginibacter straminoryzae]
MRQQDVFRKIGGILQELNEQYDYLKTQQDALNDLELELFAANANFLTDHLEILRKLNAHITKALPVHEEEKALPTVSEGTEATFILPAPETAPAETVYTLPPVETQPAAVMSEPEPIRDPEPAEQEEEIVEEPVAEEPLTASNEFHFDLKPAEPIYVEPVYPHDEEPAHQENSTTEEQESFFILNKHPEEQPVASETALPAEEPVASPVQPVEDKPVPEINLFESKGNDTFSFTRQAEPEVIRHELNLNESAAWPEEEPVEAIQNRPTILPPAEEIKPEPVAEPASEFPRAKNVSHTAYPPAEEPQRPLTLNERISAQLSGNKPAEATTTSSSQAPIKDLKSAISLNDKMLFVRDLFNGYSLAYSEAIEILNRFNNFDEASRFLTNNYVGKNNWAAKQATADRFYELLKRRFA